MKAYRFDEQGVYLGEFEPVVSPARPENDDGSPNYLFPANSTDIPPPLCSGGQVPLFDGKAWSLVEDHRGKSVYATATRQAALVNSVGPVPEGYTLTPPPSQLHDWNGQSWEPNIAAIRASAEAAIDGQADAVLASVMTLTPGRAMTYMAKEAQATACIAAGEAADPARFPLIAGEVGITGATMQEVAAVIVEKSRAWRALGAAVESVRLSAKREVREALTPEAVQTVLGGLNWPTAG